MYQKIIIQNNKPLQNEMLFSNTGTQIYMILSYVAAAAADGWRGNTWFSPVGDSGIVAKPGSWLTKVVISHSKEKFYAI